MLLRRTATLWRRTSLHAQRLLPMLGTLICTAQRQEQMMRAVAAGRGPHHHHAHTESMTGEGGGGGGGGQTQTHAHLGMVDSISSITLARCSSIL